MSCADKQITVVYTPRGHVAPLSSIGGVWSYGNPYWDALRRVNNGGKDPKDLALVMQGGCEGEFDGFGFQR